MNKLQFNGGAYVLELDNAQVFEGSVSNLVAHFKVDTITLTDRATKLTLPILSTKNNRLQINGQSMTFEQAKTAIEEALKKSGGASSAEDVSYSGVVSGSNVKEALDTVGANLGEISPKVESLMDRADLVSVQAENVGYNGGQGIQNVKTAIDGLKVDLTTFTRTETITATWEDRGESGRIWAIFELPFEIIKDTTATLSRNLSNPDTRRFYDKDGIPTGGAAWVSSLSSFVVPRGTKRIEIQARTPQTTPLNITLTATYGNTIKPIIYAKVELSATELKSTTGNRGVYKQAVDGGKYYVMQCNQESTGYRDFFARYYQADNTLIRTDQFNAYTNRTFRLGYKGWRFQTPQNTAYMVMTAYNWDGVSVDDVDIFIKEDVEFLSNENPYTYGFENVWIFGDSITATQYGSYDFGIFEMTDSSNNAQPNANGGYLPYVWNNCRIRPKRMAKWAVGGQTLSDINTPFSGSYIKQMESAIGYYDADQSFAPDLIMIVGCTNDFDQALKRYVTNEELGGADFDEYCESQFMTSGSGYGNYTLIDKDTINKGKIIGAIRYMVEVLGTKFPNARFCVVAPPHSTNHNPINQKRCVRDMEWICERLSIPFINVFKYANMPCLWDFGDNHRYLSDGVHTFYVDGQPRTGVKAQGMFIARELNRFFADKL